MHDKTLISYVRLKFNIDTPDIEEVWLDGYECSQHDIEESSNPFPPESAEYHYWNEGWWAGYYNEMPLFNLDGAHTLHAVTPKTNVAVNNAPIAMVSYLTNLIANNVFLNTLYKLVTALLASFVIYEVIGSMT